MTKEGEHSEEIMTATETAVVPQASGNDLLAMLINKDADLATIERFMDLRDREEATVARRAYTEAMAAFKASPPEIEKDAKVSYDTGKGEPTSYRHATLGNVTYKINAGLGEHGLSAAWRTEQGDGGIAVTCTITHVMGHSESTSLRASPDTTGSKNAIQALGSTISYLERYTILALAGLATQDMDDDGETSVGFITEEQTESLSNLLREKDVPQFLEYMGVEQIAVIPANEYGRAVAAASARIAELRKKAAKKTTDDKS